MNEKKDDKQELHLIHAAMRIAGINIDIATLALSIEIVDAVREKKENFNLKDANTIIEKIQKDVVLQQMAHQQTANIKK